MEYWHILLGIIVFIGFVANRMSKKERDARWEEHEARLHQAQFASSDNEADNPNATQSDMNKTSESKPDTLELMFSTLHALGCQPTKK